MICVWYSTVLYWTVLVQDMYSTDLNCVVGTADTVQYSMMGEILRQPAIYIDGLLLLAGNTVYTVHLLLITWQYGIYLAYLMRSFSTVQYNIREVSFCSIIIAAFVMLHHRRSINPRSWPLTCGTFECPRQLYSLFTVWISHTVCVSDTCPYKTSHVYFGRFMPTTSDHAQLYQCSTVLSSNEYQLFYCWLLANCTCASWSRKDSLTCCCAWWFEIQ